MNDWSWDDGPVYVEDHEIWTVRGSLERETEKAILLRVGEIEAWLPKSLIETTMKTTTDIEIQMPLWLAEEKGLDNYDCTGESLDDEIPF